MVLAGKLGTLWERCDPGEKLMLSAGLPRAPVSVGLRVCRETGLHWCRVSFAPPWLSLCPSLCALFQSARGRATERAQREPGVEL